MTTQSNRRLKAARARDLKPLPVDWLWRPYIARGTVGLLEGDPGLGKSTLAVDLAARVSRGWAMPPDIGKARGRAAGVLILSAEDDPCRVIRPRLDAAGADLDLVAVIDGVLQVKLDRPVSLPEDLDLIENAAEEIGADLVVIDPLMAFLTGAIDAHKDADIRRVLHDLKRFAESSGAAVLILRHLTKLNAGPAIYRGGGSIGIIGAARTALVVGRDPNDDEVRILAGVKNNLGPLPRSLAFSVEPAGDSSRIGWIGEVDLNADDIIAHGDRGGAKGKAEQCVETLRAMLAGCSVAATEAETSLKAAGFSLATIRRAKGSLAVESYRVAGAAGGWLWRLPGPMEGAQPVQDKRK